MGSPIWWARARIPFKVDEFVPHIQRVNLRTVAVWTCCMSEWPQRPFNPDALFRRLSTSAGDISCSKVDGLVKADGLSKVDGLRKVDGLDEVDGLVPHT